MPGPPNKCLLTPRAQGVIEIAPSHPGFHRRRVTRDPLYDISSHDSGSESGNNLPFQRPAATCDPSATNMFVGAEETELSTLIATTGTGMARCMR